MKRLTLLFFLFSFWANSQGDTLVFSHKSGFYDNPITLELNNRTNDKIYYSLNGDYPKTEYKNPIVISNSTTVRVKNKKESKGYTRNYIFQKHALPVVCLTMKPGDLYDSTYGIYVKGPGAAKEAPYHGANFHKGWEKSAYIEYLDTHSQSQFNQKIGIKIFGQYSAMLPQKSFAIYARKKYGDNRIKYRLFPEVDHKKYKTFLLRNSGSDFCSAHFRDALISDLVKELNFEKQAYRSCVVYLNGNYWGIYHLREKINERFIQQHSLYDKDSVAILKYRGSTQHYGKMNYNKMMLFIKKTDFSKIINIDSLAQLMDIDNYLDYNITQIYTNNIDAGGNIRFWRPIKKGGKWRWILFDSDFGLGLREGNRQEENTVEEYFEKSSRQWPYPDWSTLIIRKLMENDSIKKVYLKKWSHHLNTTFSQENVLKHIQKFETALEPEIEQHFKKWKRSSNIWQSHLAIMKEFAKERPQNLFNQLAQYFKLDSFYTVQLDSFSGGTLQLENKPINLGKATLFSGLPYQLVATPWAGYKFSHWTMDTTNLSPTTHLKIKEFTNVTPVFVKADNGKYKDSIQINEIGLNDGNGKSYIEIVNKSKSEIDITDWILVDNNQKKQLISNEILTIPANEYVIIYFSGKKKKRIRLTNASSLKLIDAENQIVDEVDKLNKLLKNDSILEKIESVLKNGWEPTLVNSINKKNERQLYYEKLNKYLLIGFGVFAGIVFLSIVIFLVTKKISQ